MNKNERKNSVGGFGGLVFSMLFYSISGVMVTWLGIAFTTGGQLIVRAVVAVAISLIWILISKSGFHLPKGKYNSWSLALDILTRPMFNFCFIMAVFGFREATFALLLLFTAKVLMGGLIANFFNKVKLGWFDILCYLIALVGILVYNWGGEFKIVFLWAVGSGILEAVKSEAMSKLNVEQKDKPIVSLYEFLGVAVAGLVVMFMLNGGEFIKSGGFIDGFVNDTFWGVGKTYWGIALAATAVVALALELYGFSNFSPDLGNIILATELGVAGWINYKLLSTPEYPILFGYQQIIALTIFVVAAALVSKAESFRTKEKLIET